MRRKRIDWHKESSLLGAILTFAWHPLQFWEGWCRAWRENGGWTDHGQWKEPEG